MKKPIIAIDGDGVLVNYNRAFGMVWKEHFKEDLTVVNPTAYHAHTYWGVESPEWGTPFWDVFAQIGWRNMPAMDKALEACHALVEAGYQLVCVTAIPADKHEDRLHNLKDLGFPIDEVIATGSKFGSTENPKKAAIEQLNPAFFVDDELRKLKDLPEHIRCVLVDPGHCDHHNTGQDDSYLHLKVNSLWDFAQHILLEHNNKQKKSLV